MDYRGMFDESPMELDKMRRRREIRERLRFEYNRFSMNPLAAAYCMTLPEPQIERYNAARAMRVEFIKYRWYHFLPFTGLLFSIFFWTAVTRRLMIERRVREAWMPPEWLFGRQHFRPVYMRLLYHKYWTMDLGV